MMMLLMMLRLLLMMSPMNPLRMTNLHQWVLGVHLRHGLREVGRRVGRLGRGEGGLIHADVAGVRTDPSCLTLRRRLLRMMMLMMMMMLLLLLGMMMG